VCEACGPRLSRRQALALAGGTVAAASFLVTPRVSAQAEPTDFGISIQPRAAWAGDGRPPVGELGAEDVRFLLVHHTASANGADPIGTMRGVYNFHTSAEKGWPDVAYNFFIDQNGVVYEARSGSLAGPVEASATGGSQGFAQLVCLLGDFTSRNPTEAALASLNATLAWLADRYGLDTSPGAQTTFTSLGSNRWPEGTSVTASTISGHRDMSQTACPGDTFYPYLIDNVQSEVHALRQATGGVPPATTGAVPETSSAPVSSTTGPFPEATTETSRAPETSTRVDPTTAPATTVPATVADGSVVAPPAPAADAPSADAARGSANSTALALAAGATVLVGAGAVYVGMRGRSVDDPSAEEHASSGERSADPGPDPSA